MMDSSGKMKNRIQSLGKQASDAAGAVSSMAEDATARAREVVSEASHLVGDAGAYLAEKADDATTAVGERLKAAGEMSAGMARRIQDTGDYIESRGLEGLADDMTGIIRRNPLTSVMIGFAIGFLFANALHRDA